MTEEELKLIERLVKDYKATVRKVAKLEQEVKELKLYKRPIKPRVIREGI